MQVGGSGGRHHTRVSWVCARRQAALRCGGGGACLAREAARVSGADGAAPQRCRRGVVMHGRVRGVRSARRMAGMGGWVGSRQVWSEGRPLQGVRACMGVCRCPEDIPWD